MVERGTHLSDSGVQRDAEDVILQQAAAALGVRLLAPTNHQLPDGVHVEIDGVSPDRQVFVEAYARQGRLKGAQLKKVGQDILKLSLIRRTCGTEVRTVIVLASPEAEQSIRGWLRYAADVFGVELLVVEIEEVWRERIRAAQAKQLMVNISAGDLADDVDVVDATGRAE